MNRMEAELDRLRYDENGDMTRESKAEFHDIIIEHCLSGPNCKFHCFYLHLMHLTAFFLKQPTMPAGIKFLSWNRRMKRNKRDKRMKESLHGCRN